MDRMGEAGLPLLMNRDMLDRLIVARLIESPPTDYPQTPVQYLLGCYQRADDELRNRTVAGSAQLSGTEQCCRDLVVNYAGLTLSGGIVPHLGAQVCVCACVLLGNIQGGRPWWCLMVLWCLSLGKACLALHLTC